ncbi:MAG: adenylate/guanylate cyclase domain-containing protein [Gemmataceae bacterium]
MMVVGAPTGLVVNPMLRIDVMYRQNRETIEHAEGDIEFGRGPGGSVRRVVLSDPFVSRDQLRIRSNPSGTVTVENLSRKRELTLHPNQMLSPGETANVDLPATMTVGETSIRVGAAAPPDFDFATLAHWKAPIDRGKESLRLFDLGDMPSPERLTYWIQQTLAWQNEASDLRDLTQRTCKAAVEMVGLDQAMLLTQQGESWRIDALHSASQAKPRFSQTLVAHICETKETAYQSEGTFDIHAPSLAGVESVVVSPIFSMQGEVVAALYGSRFRARHGHVGIRPLEAQMIQMLAGGIGSRLTRDAALRTRVQFERFFSPELVRQLEANPNLLEGMHQTITVLMCDLRGFTAMSERIEPAVTCVILQDVMERLTACILQEDGVVVDYAGDGILAMWNAPAPQPDHAARACRAGQSMLAVLPALNDRWAAVAQTTIGLGIGINTGAALVGNTGSKTRLKYGPHGFVVNLASRVQSATKQFGEALLLTESVCRELRNADCCREAGKATLQGVQGEVPLFRLTSRIEK